MALIASDTALLLRCNGADNSTVFTDNSPKPKTVTRYGGAKISTAQSKFDGSSVYFDGAGSCLLATSADFAFGAGAFTMATHLFLADSTRNGGFGTLAQSTDGPLSGVSVMVYGGAPRVRVGRSASGAFDDIMGVGTLEAGQWYHMEASRDAVGTVVLRINGVLNAQGVSTRSLSMTTFVAGRTHATYDGEYTCGYMGDIHVVYGRALHSSDFTPPTAPATPLTVYAAIQAQGTGLAKLAKYDPSQTRPAARLVTDDLQDRWPYGPWKTPAVQWEFKGRGVVSGTVKTIGTPNNTPVARLVRLHREPDGMFVKAVWSDPATGAYSFVGVRPDCKYFVTSFDHQHTYRAVVADNLIVTAL